MVVLDRFSGQTITDIEESNSFKHSGITGYSTLLVTRYWGDPLRSPFSTNRNDLAKPFDGGAYSEP